RLTISMGDAQLEQITLYLKRLSDGDASAEGPLAEIVYARMRTLARAILRKQASDLTLQPTALANEVLLQLVLIRSVDWKDRVHFFNVAARLLRRRIIDHIRQQRAVKRPQGAARVDLDDLLLPSEDRFEEVLFVHEGLDQLEKFDPRLASLVEMVYFGGIPLASVAELRGVSEKTIDRHL